MHLALLLAVSAAAAPFRTEKAEGLKALNVSAAAGDVRVLADAKVKDVVVDLLGEDEDEECRLTVERRDDELRVRAEKKTRSSKSCRVGWNVTAPKGFAVKAAAGSGALSV